ncbi:hypothetical protein [Paraburkholderia heleia]|uniref:hypothetical protein n=1 Tax=Paraburkholderia heleia TaxID=634127 RepID=UPI002AB67DB6|nr:hypothetical protein [Paraburkholderia heleia]
MIANISKNLRKYLFFPLLGNLLFVSFSVAHSDALSPKGESDGDLKQYSENYKYGVMNGVKLKIPDNYLMNGVEYEGERRDGTDSGLAETKQSKIDNFGILLRLSTLRPIETDADLHDWHAAQSKPIFQKNWMMVSFDNHYPIKKNSDGPDMIPAWGPYVADKIMPYGLMHFESTQSVDDGARNQYGHVEYFYNRSTLTTIMCQTHKPRTPPFNDFSICHHYFFIPDLNVMAEAFYTKNDVSRWKKIEDEVKKIAHSFIVY